MYINNPSAFRIWAKKENEVINNVIYFLIMWVLCLLNEIWNLFNVVAYYLQADQTITIKHTMF